MTLTSEPLTLPVLPLDDEVVLPGMVVPLDLNDADVRAAVEAAQAAARSSGGSKPRVLLVPRIDGTYANTGVLGTVEQVGRLADGDPGALIRGRGRARHPGNGRHIFGPRPALVFVRAAKHDRFDRQTAAKIKKPGAFRSVKFVRARNWRHRP